MVSKSGQAARYLDAFDEVDQHFNETVNVHRNENPLQQVT